MTRDFNLIRQIMRDAEGTPAGYDAKEFQYPGYDNATVQNHLALLVGDAQLLTGHAAKGPDGLVWTITGITWKGFDFIEASRDDSIWEKAQEVILKPAGSFTFDLLLAWLKMKAKERLGLP